MECEDGYCSYCQVSCLCLCECGEFSVDDLFEEFSLEDWRKDD